LKVGGWARFEVGYGYNGSFTNEMYNNNVNNRTTNDNNWRVKGIASFDARSQTEYGTVRSYITLGVSTNVNGDDGAATATYSNRWFIQWAGFTMGHSTSFFDFYSIGANQYGFVNASSDTGDGGWTVFGYTANFGNGLSASISAEQQRRTKINYAGNMVTGATFTPVAFTTAGAGYEGHDYPDVVANLRVDQTWGSAQIMGALHNVATTYYGADELTGHPSDKMGFALGAGIKLNVPMTGMGDYFQAEVVYTQGASRYANHTSLVGDYSIYHGSEVGFGLNTDAVFGGTVAAGTASDLELTTSWSANAAFTHNWNAAWKSTLWGSYMAMSYNENANNMLCDAAAGANLGSAAVPLAGCNMDWQAWGAGLRTQWAVSSTFQIGLEVLYARLETADLPGTINFSPGSGKPAGAFYHTTDQDNWAFRFRANRDFYP
jgi:hypothetical protein